MLYLLLWPCLLITGTARRVFCLSFCRYIFFIFLPKLCVCFSLPIFFCVWNSPVSVYPRGCLRYFFISTNFMSTFLSAAIAASNFYSSHFLCDTSFYCTVKICGSYRDIQRDIQAHNTTTHIISAEIGSWGWVISSLSRFTLIYEVCTALYCVRADFNKWYEPPTSPASSCSFDSGLYHDSTYAPEYKIPFP